MRLASKPLLAFDRTARSVDADGHMRVAESKISKANICPYSGHEIPNFEALGLDPQKVYRLLRDPNELRKGASTFEGKPLLVRHIPVTAQAPQKDSIVGTIGKVTYEDPYLVARPLTVWTQEAIDLIESEAQRELSSAYRYEAVMEPGTFNGEPYDGRMTNIEGNHVAIVSEGRAGPDVLVADEKPKRLELKAVKNPTLMARLFPFLKAGTDVFALDEALGETEEESVMSLDAEEERDAEDEARDVAHRARGADAEPTEEERKEAKDRARDRKRRAHDKAKDAKRGKDESEEEKERKAEDAHRSRDESRKARDARRARDEERDDEEEEAEDRAEAAEDEERKKDGEFESGDAKREAEDRRRARDERKEARDARKHARDEMRRSTGQDRRGKDAMPDPKDHRRDFRSGDSVTKDEMNAAIKAAVAATRQSERDLAAATQAVAPVVGIVAMDSAENTYKFALERLGVSLNGVPASAYKALFETYRTASARTGGKEAESVAMDGSTDIDLDRMFGVGDHSPAARRAAQRGH